jgi:RimJ/RimL family protein N-acetyltransferase
MRTDPSFTELTTDRLLLRRSAPEDADLISAYRSDPEVHVHQGWERTDPEGVRAEIEEMQRRAPGALGGWVQLSAFDRVTGELVGDVGLAVADGEPDVIKVGYTIAPEHQGNGFATEAVAALVDYAFGVLTAHVVRAYADADNVRSIRVMEKVGMSLMERFEGEEDGERWVGVRYERRRDT